jgi:hypothetical protein
MLVRKVGPEINVEKAMHLLLSRQQNVGQKCDMQKANGSFEKFITVQIIGKYSHKSKIDSGES